MAHTIIFTKKPLLYCTCGGLPMETTAKKCLMTAVADSVAAGEGKLTAHPFHKGTTIAAVQTITMHTSTEDDAFPAIIEGDVSEIETVPLELPDASLIQTTSLKFAAWGK